MPPSKEKILKAIRVEARTLAHPQAPLSALRDAVERGLSEVGQQKCTAAQLSAFHHLLSAACAYQVALAQENRP